jgi:homoserine O-succinyltransferase
MPLLSDPRLPCLSRLESDEIEWRPSGSHSPDLRIAILNLMPEKEIAEYHLLSRLGTSSRWLEFIWLVTESYTPKNAPRNHIETFYTVWSKVRDQDIDGLIVTGAPVELMPFEAVTYWPELQRIFDWGADHCRGTYAICWAAQAALYHFWDIDKTVLDRKLSGIYEHPETDRQNPLMAGIEPGFSFPYSRYTGNPDKPIRYRRDLSMAAYSPEAGPAVITDRAFRLTMVTGHPEYDRNRLQYEYNRDCERGLNPHIPARAFLNDDPATPPLYPWHEPAITLYLNWVEQLTR